MNYSRPPAMPRQTVSYLMRRFEEVGLHPMSKHGQNFLIDMNLLNVLVQTADVRFQDVVLEVGTGTGSLTSMIAPQAGAVVTVELDAHLHQLASEVLLDYPHVEMLQQDALKNKNHLHPNVIAAVQQQINVAPGRRLKLVANLPYNIATPIISNLLTIDPVPTSMTVTIQKEVAERITAKPSTKDYSSLSVWMQALCDVRIVKIMPPSVFWPRPKVDSAIIHIVPNAEKRSRIPDLDYFHRFVRSLFFHRRKFLRSVLVAACKEQLDKPGVDQIMAEMKFGPDVRAEQLDVETILTLSHCVRRACEKGESHG